jgi:hypothetical protein
MIKGEEILCYYPSGKCDGSPEFEREAKKFATFHLVPADNMCLIPDTADRDQRRRLVLSHLRRNKERGIKSVAFFCHGWKTGFWMGWNLGNIKELASDLPNAQDMTVVLYSCSTGSGGDETVDMEYPGPGAEGGFADHLRDALEARGRKGRIVAHTTAGHTTSNPNAIRLESSGDPAVRGETLAYITKKSKFWKPWVAKLRETTLRFAFPYLTQLQLTDEIKAK